MNLPTGINLPGLLRADARLQQTGDQFLKVLTMDHALEHHIVQVQFSRQRLKSGTLGTVSCDD